MRQKMALRATVNGSQCRRFPPTCTYVLAACLFATTVGILEGVARSQGHRPAVPDSSELWAYHRSRVYRDDGRVIVLIGASRMQCDVSVSTLQSLAPTYRVVQLASFGHGSPLAVLEDLAADAHFNGVILCEMIAPYVASRRKGDQSDLVACHPRFAKQSEILIRSFLSDLLVCRKATLSLRSFYNSFRCDEFYPEPDFQSLTFDRNLYLDFHYHRNIVQYRLLKSREYESYYALEFPAIVQKQFEADIQHVGSFARRVRARGGNIVFISFPSTGLRAKLENSKHPRREYWDRFAQMVHAVCLHSDDLLDRFECPDYSHLDGHSACRFTESLHAALVERQVLRGPSFEIRQSRPADRSAQQTVAPAGFGSVLDSYPRAHG
jgi:hypothetical protein